MLTLEIDLDQLSNPWHRQGDRLCGPAGAITPLDHAMVSTRTTVAPDSWQIHVTENHGGADSLLVEGNSTRIRCVAGPGGVCPLYLVLDGSVLRGSWNPAELLPFVSPNRLIEHAVTRLLTRRQRYSTNTIFDGLHKITERSVATVDHAGISISYPEPAEHVLRARDLRPDTDPIDAFDRLLANRLAPLAQAAGLRRAVEISGGLDSATVATAITRRGAHGLASVGLTVDGIVGTQQAARRAAIIDRLSLRDYTTQASAHLPFEPHGPRSTDRLHYADGDVYVEAFDHLRDQLSRDGVQVILTGFGGDELMALRGTERPSGWAADVPELPRWLGRRALDALHDLDANTAPVSPVALPTLMVFAARNPAYVAQGLWPAAPLADPGLLRLCESLPVSWRSGKALLRRYLQRAGFGPLVTHPETVESFQATMELAMQQTGTAMLAQMMDDSILVDHGYLDRAALGLVHADMAADGIVPPLLYDTLAVERSLQSVRSAVERNGVTQ